MSDYSGPAFGNTHPMLRHCWHPVALSSELGEQPVAVGLVGERWALVRIGTRVTMLRDECPHRRAPLHAGRVVEGALQCPYHGYRFSADGTCVHIPSQAPGVAIAPKASCRAAARVVERYGLVWASIEEPINELPEVPEYGTDGFAVVELPPQVWRAGGAQLADNFIDLAHVPFVHADTFADPSADPPCDATITRTPNGFEATVRNTAKRLSDVLDHTDGFVTVERVNHFRFTAPFNVYLRIDFPDGTVLVLLFFTQPVDENHVRLYTLNVRNDLITGATTVEEAIKLGEAVLAEDRSIVEQLPSTELALDLTTEHHTRADRASVELRRVLADLCQRH